MPGTFAVFALGLEGRTWGPLVCDYLDRCDDEHSSLQEKFLHALIRKFGFKHGHWAYWSRGALSMQWLKPAREFRSLIANEESLDALLTDQTPLFRLSPAGRGQGPEIPGHRLAGLLWAIWGSSSENGGSKVIKSAPKELKEKYHQVFA